jgi:ribosomal protein L11 methyltransferase
MTLALIVTVPAGEVELASDALWALGVAAVEERDPTGTPTEDHFVELWTSLGDDHDAVAQAAEAFPARWRWHTVELDESVSESWRAHAVPTWVERDVVVVPSWLEPAIGDDVLRIDIDPGAAFGLGDHPTTVLSMRLLRHTWWTDATVLDVGCGSGVLGILAAKLGAPYVQAIDISAAAVDATRRNAERNGVAAVIDVSGAALADVTEAFPIVVANILAPTLVELAPDLRRLVAPGGALIISGVLTAAHGHVLEALAPMRAVETITRDGWAAVLLRH